MLPREEFEYLRISLRSLRSCLHLIPPCLPVPSVFPSITCSSWPCLRKLWPIQSTFLHFFVCWIFLSSWALCSTYFFTLTGHLTSAVHRHHILELSRHIRCTFRSVQISSPYYLRSKCCILLVSFLNLNLIFCWSRSCPVVSYSFFFASSTRKSEFLSLLITQKSSGPGCVKSNKSGTNTSFCK